ncbi:TIM21 [Scenedesmus sp. PABB004]|nr:TIM21 [Scenedesmus sp. PABB004]
MSLLRARPSQLLLCRLMAASGAPARAGGLPAAAAQQQQLAARHIACGAAAAAAAFQPNAALNIALPVQLGLAARFLSSSSHKEADSQPAKQPPQEEAFDSLELTEQKMHAITDKIPQKPVTLVEGASYSVVIVGAFAVLAFFVYNFVTQFILEPTYQTCFNATLAKLKLDPRVTVRLGNDIVGYGQESASRVQRQQIPHQVYKDANGVEHVRLQFNMRGPGGVAIVNADMFKGPGGAWEYLYLIVDVKSGAAPPQRLNIVAPRSIGAPAASAMAISVARLRWGSVVLLGLALLSWVIALGGLGAMNWLVCSDHAKTVADITANLGDNFGVTGAAGGAVVGAIGAVLGVPPAGSPASMDVPLCSRSWRWEWFALFFQFALMASGVVVSLCPSRLVRARFPLANMLSIATVVIMVAVNDNVTDVWFFWDTHKLFNEWAGVMAKLYMSAAALVAGWVRRAPRAARRAPRAGSPLRSRSGPPLRRAGPRARRPPPPCVSPQILTIFFNLVWIGFALDAEVEAEPYAAPAAAPITGDVEAAAAAAAPPRK